jgi:hypothetical protein
MKRKGRRDRIGMGREGKREGNVLEKGEWGSYKTRQQDEIGVQVNEWRACQLSSNYCIWRGCPMPSI